ncbi:hypothetical protein E4U54_007305 [Claviceps lovelessii]|nr:hypothetical protein E4U54_007305 [Claviceps lovelessii]
MLSFTTEVGQEVEELRDELVQDDFPNGASNSQTQVPSPSSRQLLESCSATSLTSIMGTQYEPFPVEYDMESWSNVFGLDSDTPELGHASTLNPLPSPAMTTLPSQSVGHPSSISVASCTAVNRSSGDDSATEQTDLQCNCLARIANLIDEFVSSGHENSLMDALLDAVRNALNRVSAVNCCTPCRKRKEVLILLTLLISKLADSVYLIPALFQSGANNLAKQPRGAFIGDYEIESELEWEMIMQTLALLLIQRLVSLAETVRDTVNQAEDGNLNQRLATVQGRLAGIFTHLQTRASRFG